MSKAIKYALIILIVLLIAGFFILTFMLDSIVKSNMEQIGSEMTGTPVTIDNVSISPFTGQGTITGFRVANPEGYSTEHAVEVDDFFIQLDVYSLWSDLIVVEEVIITSPSVYVEQKLPENNLRTILNNINEALSTGTSMEADVVIDHFLMEDGSADLYTEIGGERSARVEMSNIELHDLGRGGGQQAIEEIVKEIAERVIEQALQAAGRSGTEQLRDAFEDIFN
ncbi:MAG: AsmA family protein [Balneolales bacterium]